MLISDRRGLADLLNCQQLMIVAEEEVRRYGGTGEEAQE